jgi:3-deoxy-D-manno-octulosonate 8-phosphate phosphatase (KDO 8-P phosphatase)
VRTLSDKKVAVAGKSWPALGAIHTIAFDFDGVFTDNKVYVAQDGGEFVRCDRADGLGIDLLRAAQARGRLAAEVFVLTKERNPVTEARARKLRLACHAGCDDKLDFVTRRLNDARRTFEGLLYVGNDINDLAVMERAGFSVAPADAHERVRRIASAVLPQNGGNGFVRAFVERLLDIENMTSKELHELVHHR